MGRLDGITVSMDMSLSKLWEMVKDREAWQAAAMQSQRVRHTEPLNSVPRPARCCKPCKSETDAARLCHSRSLPCLQCLSFSLPMPDLP